MMSKDKRIIKNNKKHKAMAEYLYVVCTQRSLECF